MDTGSFSLSSIISVSHTHIHSVLEVLQWSAPCLWDGFTRCVNRDNRLEDSWRAKNYKRAARVPDGGRIRSREVAAEFEVALPSVLEQLSPQAGLAKVFCYKRALVLYVCPGERKEKSTSLWWSWDVCVFVGEEGPFL